MRKIPIAAAALTFVLAGTSAIALPSGSSGPGLPSQGVLITKKPATVRLSQRDGYFMDHATAPPHASFGWHYHRTPVIVVITSGTLTLYDSSGSKCAPTRYHAGQGFIEPAHHLHLARNESDRPVSFYVVYIGVPPALRKHPSRLDVFGQPRPRKCPASIH
jgi:quercetin dioxygenase-like cupin family protein